MILALSRAIRRFCRREDGTVTVEFIATAPLLVAALVFIFEFGRALWAHQIVEKGVRDATRYLTRAPLTQTFVDQAVNIAKTGAATGGSTHFPWTDAATVVVDQAALTFTAADFREGGNVIEITATVPMDLASLSLFGMDTSINLVVTDQARHIGE
jgi:Flp pilus assembly protein TadG